jgi:hypothetical protein
MISSGSNPNTSIPPIFAALRDRIDALATSYHVALDTLDARRLRADPNLVSIPGFLLFDTAEYEPVLGLVPLPIFWRMQGMDILAHSRNANRQRRAGPNGLPMSGSVWLVDATLDCSQPDPAANQAAAAPCDGASGRLPPCLRITALQALDRVSIEPGGPRHIESIDTLAMLPRFTTRS